MISAAGCERISSHRVEAIAADAHMARRSNGRPLLAGENIRAGTGIETGADGRADLQVFPNMLLRLEENGGLEIADLKFSVDGNETSGGVRERDALVRLGRGKLVARLEQHGYNTTRLTLDTSRGQIRVDGDALFELDEQPGVTKAVCVSGQLDIIAAAADHISTISPGEAMRMDSTGSHHFGLPPEERALAEERCAKVELALKYEANAQIEARR